MNATYEILFEAGSGDGYWCIEEDSDGRICVTSNAETHRPIEPDQYLGWDAAEWRDDLERAGIPTDLIDRILQQAGF